jgi:hypothetical protein
VPPAPWPGASRQSPSPTWRTFLENHVKDLGSVDFFVVPTLTFKVLLVFLVLVHARRRVVHFNVTEHPTAHWTAQQNSEAFPWEAAARFVVRDRDRVYGLAFRDRVERRELKRYSARRGVRGRTRSPSG